MLFLQSKVLFFTSMSLLSLKSFDLEQDWEDELHRSISLSREEQPQPRDGPSLLPHCSEFTSLWPSLSKAEPNRDTQKEDEGSNFHPSLLTEHVSSKSVQPFEIYWTIKTSFVTLLSARLFPPAQCWRACTEMQGKRHRIKHRKPKMWVKISGCTGSFGPTLMSGPCPHLPMQQYWYFFPSTTSHSLHCLRHYRFQQGVQSPPDAWGTAHRLELPANPSLPRHVTCLGATWAPRHFPFCFEDVTVQLWCQLCTQHYGSPDAHHCCCSAKQPQPSLALLLVHGSRAQSGSPALLQVSFMQTLETNHHTARETYSLPQVHLPQGCQPFITKESFLNHFITYSFKNIRVIQ